MARTEAVGEVTGEADRLRAALAADLAGRGLLDDPAWRAAVEDVPRHAFVPGCYVETDRREHGSPV